VYLGDYIGNGGLVTGEPGAIEILIWAGSTNPGVISSRMKNGASNTVFAGEKAVSVSGVSGTFASRKYVGAGYAGGDPGDVDGIFSWADGDTVAYASPNRGPMQDPQADIVLLASTDPFLYRQANLGFGSSHPGSMNAVFCDGSVRPVSYGIKTAVFQAVCNNSNRTPVDLSDL